MTSLEVILLATAELEHYALFSKRLWPKFCHARGYQFHACPEILLPDMHVNWSKIEMVRRHLDSSTCDKLGSPADAGHFNSGLMVVDLAPWMDDGIGSAAKTVFTERPDILTFNDQCALNVVLAGRYR